MKIDQLKKHTSSGKILYHALNTWFINSQLWNFRPFKHISDSWFHFDAFDNFDVFDKSTKYSVKISFFIRFFWTDKNCCVFFSIKEPFHKNEKSMLLPVSKATLKNHMKHAQLHIHQLNFFLWFFLLIPKKFTHFTHRHTILIFCLKKIFLQTKFKYFTLLSGEISWFLITYFFFF